MARATTGGRIPVGGWRRSCRRWLPALLVLAAFVPVPVHAATDSDAWMSARQTQLVQSMAIGAAAQELSDGVEESELRELRRRVFMAVRAMDRLEVRDCFRVWWSYVRTSYVLYDQALMGLEASDLMRVQSATAASMFLTSMAANTPVDCPRSASTVAGRPQPHPAGGYPLLAAPQPGIAG